VLINQSKLTLVMRMVASSFLALESHSRRVI
jgi:hypothetical protein